ncbi:hypothetical protein NDR87_11945 [Nocardia sp. CDC159]|uniref:Uncharacterized protein n=1 Tax=Nocardia pulmonis TaxID=2951408 RepID=A0A9X2E5I2_9NOCA|nr:MULTISPECIES: hypothetical protein [Nocardia]MCM6774184.1 hypothetical protein [Nocardia pulmonis]MCM6787071.1 hypothetical protein [Nocardia sp. CDC159]
MSATCPACSWSSPMVVSAHGSVRYLRCVCGRWLVAHRGGVSVVAARSACASAAAPAEHLELIPPPEG